MKLFRKSRDDDRQSHVVDHRAMEAQEQYRLYQQQKQHYSHGPQYPQQQYMHQPIPPPQPTTRPRHRQQRHPQRHHPRPQRVAPPPPPPPPPPANEYEYVRREHGFDYMPPSQYVPSRSLSEETDDIDDDPVKIDVLSSDLSNSDNGAYEVDYHDPYERRKQQKTPVVRGKPVDVKAMARRIEKHGVVQPHYRKPPVPVEAMDYHRHNRSRTIEKYPQEDDSALISPTTPRQAPRPVERREKAARGYDSRRGRREPNYRDENNFVDAEQEDLPRVPTAYSYDSRDSMEEVDASNLARYAIETKRSRKKKKEVRDKTHGRGKRRGELDTFNQAAYHSRNRREPPNPVPEVVIDAPRERRSDTHKSHRRSKSRDLREPIARPFEEPPLGIEPPRRDIVAEYGLEDPMDEYTNEPYYGDPRMAHGYVLDDPGLRRELEANGIREKRRSKGIFGRIKNGLRGEKSNKSIVERAWDKELREKEMLGKTPASISSDLSPYPTYQLDVPSARVPYPYDDGYYEQATRMSSKPPPPPGVLQPPQPHQRRQTGYDQRGPPPDYNNMYGEGPGPKPPQPSGKPFQTSRATTPILRANPDQRQRYIPMNTSMSKQYRSQHQGMGGVGGRESHSPGPQSRRGILGCV